MARKIPVEVPSEQLEALPAFLREMVQACGIAPALRLVELRGGTVVRMPINHEDPRALDNKLWAQLGVQAAVWLSEQHGGEYVQIPTAKSYLTRLRNEELWRRSEDQSATQLALHYRIHIRTVWRLLARLKHARPARIDVRQQRLL